MRYANKISALRILTTPFFVAAIYYYDPQHSYLRIVALGIFILAVISDAVDGMVARLNHEDTAIGPIIDPLADKLLLISAYIVLYVKGAMLGNVVMPLWVVLVIICRDLVIAFGTFLIYIVRQHVKIIPTSWGKFTTFFQMATIISVLLQFDKSFIFYFITVMFTFISGIDYLRRGIKLFTLGDVE